MSRKAQLLTPSEVTIKDIAVHLGISHSTVSRALNDHPTTSRDTKDRVRKLARDLGYIKNAGPAMIQGTASKLIGFIAPDVRNDFYSTVASVVAESCALEGFQLVLAISEDDPELELRHVLALRQARVAGIVITPSLHFDARAAELLRPVATIQLVRCSDALTTRAVLIDDPVGTRLATAHLLDLGHRRIAFVGGTEGLSTSRERLRGVQEAHQQAGLALDPRWVALGPPRPAFGREAVARLLELDETPTAIVMGSGQLTLGAIALLHEKGIRVPADLSLVGYGDPMWFQSWGPGITTVGLPTDELAAAAVSSLFRRMHIRESQADRGFLPELTGAARFPPQLMIRGSTAPPPAGNAARTGGRRAGR